MEGEKVSQTTGNWIIASGTYACDDNHSVMTSFSYFLNNRFLSETENALIAMVVILSVVVLVLVVVTWRIRRKLGDSLSDPHNLDDSDDSDDLGPTTRLI